MKTIPAICFLLILTACGGKNKYRKAADEMASNAPEPTNMNAGKREYTIAIPEGWTAEHRSANGVDYYFLLAPKTKDDPNTNINVTTEFMQHLSLEDYEAKSIESVKKYIPTSAITAQGDIDANGLNGKWYSYTIEPQGIKASLVNYVFPKDGIAYTITAGTQTKDAARYRNTFDSVARSLRFTRSNLLKK